MLTFISADNYFFVDVNTYSGLMTTGVYAGKRYRGSIIIPVPLGNYSREVLDTKEFSSWYSGFFNLNNCFHSKASGIVIARPGVSTTASPTDSIFGPMVCLGGTCHTNIVASSSYELYKCIRGNFNSCKEGNWWFGLGIVKIGNTYIYTVGDADLEKDTHYKGTYFSFQAIELEPTDMEHVRYRTTTLSFNSDGIRTSQMSPNAAIALYRNQILTQLSYAKWKVVANADFGVSGDKSRILSPKAVAPYPDMSFPVVARNPNWAALASQAYQSVKFFNSNGIALAGDLKRLRSDVKSTKDLISVAMMGGAKPALVAKLFLAFYYGWRLLIMDLKGVSAAVRSIANLSSRNQKCSANVAWEAGNASYKAYFHCYYERYGLLASQIDQLVSEFGLELNFSNIWDMIPFSFVVDWFTGIGSLLDQLDSYYQMTQEHKIVCTGKSIKCRRQVSCSTAGLKGWLGSIDMSLYIREYSADVTYPQFSFSKPKTFNHYVEGTALIVSRR